MPCSISAEYLQPDTSAWPRLQARQFCKVCGAPGCNEMPDRPSCTCSNGEGYRLACSVQLQAVAQMPPFCQRQLGPAVILSARAHTGYKRKFGCTPRLPCSPVQMRICLPLQSVLRTSGKGREREVFTVTLVLFSPHALAHSSTLAGGDTATARICPTPSSVSLSACKCLHLTTFSNANIRQFGD